MKRFRIACLLVLLFAALQLAAQPKLPDWNKAAMFQSVVLDDVGAESPISDFGIRRELVGEFITRYHLYGRGRLFISTNLSGEELEARYTMRVLSRIKDLTVFLNLRGGDKRTFANDPTKGVLK